MNLFDPTIIIKAGGYVAIFAILFAESGILIGFLLPGDSLLFTAGFLAFAGYLNLTVLIIVSFIGAVLGDTLGYVLGKKYGHKIFKRQDSFFFHQDHIIKAEKFYKRHGGKTIIFARFLPVIRTAAPIFAGVGNMPYGRFVAYNLTGGALWVVSLSLFGYFLGKVVPNADRYVIPIIFGVIIFSAFPSLIAVIRNKESRAKAREIIRHIFCINKKMMDFHYQRPPEIKTYTSGRHSKSAVIWKYLKYILLGFITLAIAGFIFIKLDTTDAAEITDKYLRPIFGDRQVIFVEKIFFNASDKAAKVVYDFKKPLAPQFLNSNAAANIPTSLDLKPLPSNPTFTALPDEGIWRNVSLTIFPDKEVMAYTFVRPDSTRSFAIVSLVKIDSAALTMGSVAGIYEPGGKVGKHGTGQVPKSIVQSGNLVAAFDGGFQYRDGAYGMIVDKTTYLPLKNDLGTVVGYNDGSVKIFDYTGQDLGNNTTFVRQNGPMLIENGNITVENPDSQKVWGRVVGADTFTWRSGIGETQNGELIFAAGNNLSPQTLAQALSVAGAVNAIQLDINPHWVRFNIFNSIGSGQYDSAPLNKDMSDGSKEYLKGYQKDFFYVYKK